MKEQAWTEQTLQDWGPWTLQRWGFLSQAWLAPSYRLISARLKHGFKVDFPRDKTTDISQTSCWFRLGLLGDRFQVELVILEVVSDHRGAGEGGAAHQLGVGHVGHLRPHLQDKLY